MITISVPVKMRGRADALSASQNICWLQQLGRRSMETAERSTSVARRYRGPNSNNGKIPYSVREAAKVLNVGRSTAQRCFERLIAHGFLRVSKRSGFSMKGRVSTEWLLSEFPDDTTATTGIASKDFMKWTPQNSFHSPISDTHSPTSGPGVDLRRDRVA